MENIEEKINNSLCILLEIKSLIKLGALASDSCIIDKQLQLEDNVEYYFLLRKIVDLITQVENLLLN